MLWCIYSNGNISTEVYTDYCFLLYIANLLNFILYHYTTWSMEFYFVPWNILGIFQIVPVLYWRRHSSSWKYNCNFFRFFSWKINKCLKTCFNNNTIAMFLFYDVCALPKWKAFAELVIMETTFLLLLWFLNAPTMILL